MRCVHGIDVRWRHVIPALNTTLGSPGIIHVRSFSNQFPGHGCMDDLTTVNPFALRDPLGSIVCYSYTFQNNL